ncbi:hypothetical protein [Nocardioides sp. InS609-2]|uniref:hypothetical protein n=1 Tax=Nocardioides sp. InS609-2 TaxID=2760705 RepID=UPI0020C04FC9|nr:hypothetical protein [Nocardioides sp. InS609-2]
MPVSRRALGDAVASRGLTITNATGYYGKVGRLLPGAPADTPTDPPVDEVLGVLPYFVVYPGTGGDGPDANLGDESIDTTQLIQITAVASDAQDLLALVDRIEAAFNRWTPIVAGHVCGRLRKPPGFDPGQPIPDRQNLPVRLFVPLQYQLDATT